MTTKPKAPTPAKKTDARLSWQETTLLHPATGMVIFSHKELASPDTGEVLLADKFAEELIKLRALFGMPMHVNSCCRTQAHNTSLPGAHPRSLHLMHNSVHDIDGTAAIDVAVGNAAMTRRLLVVAIRLGWSFGLGKSFVHLDRRDFAKMEPGSFGYS